MVKHDQRDANITAGIERKYSKRLYPRRTRASPTRLRDSLQCARQAGRRSEQGRSTSDKLGFLELKTRRPRENCAKGLAGTASTRTSARSRSDAATSASTSARSRTATAAATTSTTAT